MEIRSAIPTAEDYKEPKGAFLLLVKNLALEGYSFHSVTRGMWAAYRKVTHRPSTDDWRALFEAMGDFYAFNDDQRDTEEGW